MTLDKKSKPKKILCELCGYDNVSALHLHHIIERTEIECTNSYWNLCVVCSNCHNKNHSEDSSLKILGLLPSTKPPYGRTLIYEIDGKKNIDVDIPPPPLPKQMKVNYD